MKMKFLYLTVFALGMFSCVNKTSHVDDYQCKSSSTLDSIYKYYGVSGIPLLRETYPFDEGHQATYLDNAEQMNRKNPYAYLWPYSGSLSAVTALYEATGDAKYKHILEDRVLPGLQEYYDVRRSPSAYASYINSAPLSDRFYDDNIWIGLDFTDLYLVTQESWYLEKALEVWKFIESGTDTVLGDGIYWCEQRKESKNTCSNAPGSVYALKLFQATGDSVYLDRGIALYEWTKVNLQDVRDYLYYDNKRLDGHIGKAKFAYNSGQMLQSASLLYRLTGEENYLLDAQRIAKSAYDFFFYSFIPEDVPPFRLLNKGNVWFTAIMMRGFVELYSVDGNSLYMDTFRSNLDYAWEHMRDASGLFESDWSGVEKDNSKWLLTQFAMVEMYARMGMIESRN